MAEERVPRRLAAILAADVVGYSRMMGRDEAGTLARLKSLREGFLHPKVAEYGGRIVKTTGDGTLIEFGSAVDAVSHAVDVQRGMVERNAGVPEEEQIWLRLGINVGDIIIDGDDIYGDGVNVAARLEALAEPGSICISDRVHDYVGDRLDIACEDLGRQTVKNIAEPVHVYRIRLGDIEAPVASESQEPLPLSSKPSIAVLPFANMSGDAEQEYFSDGISEDLITALSRIHWFFVSARNSTFTYKGTPKDIRQIATELGVRYVVEGSVRKSDNRVRITVQLIDGLTGNHVWAERYDRELGNVFDLQDEIIEQVVGALEPAVSKSEIQRSKAKRPENLDAWDLCQRGWWHQNRNTPGDMERALALFEQALDADPESVSALAGISFALTYRMIIGSDEGHAGRISEAIQCGQRAVALDADDPLAHLALGTAYGVAEDFEHATRSLEKALNLNPYNAAAHYRLGNVYMTNGRLDEGIEHVRKAMKLSPQDSRMGGFYGRLAQAYLCKRDYEKAKEFAEEALAIGLVSWRAHSYLVSALGHLGDKGAAKRALEDLTSIMPQLNIRWLRSQRSTLSMGHEYLEDYVLGLRKAGVPE